MYVPATYNGLSSSFPRIAYIMVQFDIFGTSHDVIFFVFLCSAIESHMKLVIIQTNVENDVI